MTYSRALAMAIGLGLAVILLSLMNLHCAGDPKDVPPVLQRVKGELAVGRQEAAILRRDQLAEQLRMCRVLYDRFKADGETERARETAKLIHELKLQLQTLTRLSSRSSVR